MWHVAGEHDIRAQQIARFNTTGEAQHASLTAGPKGVRMMVFTGKQTKEDLVWCA